MDSQYKHIKKGSNFFSEPFFMCIIRFFAKAPVTLSATIHNWSISSKRTPIGLNMW